MRNAIRTIAALLCMAGAPSAMAQGTGMRADLVVAGFDPATPGKARIGVRVRLDKGWKTYWRSPGENGIPSAFDWSGSSNLRKATVAWPAPHRITMGSFETIGYTDEVVFPVELEPEDASKPVMATLRLELYGCEALCVREDVDLSALVPVAPSGPGPLSRIKAWSDRVPSEAGKGMRVTAMTVTEGKPHRIRIEVSSDAGFKAPDVFVESDPPVLSGTPVRVDSAPGKASFEIEATDADRPGTGTTRPWTVTVVDGDASAAAVR